MKKKFLEYLKSIGIISTAERTKIQEIYDECILLLDETPQDIFVDEYIDSEGQRIYECINFFTENFHFSADIFKDKNSEYNFGPVKNIVKSTIEKTEYDLKKATDRSRITIRFFITDMAGGELKASRENCDVALFLFKKYLFSKLATQAL